MTILLSLVFLLSFIAILIGWIIYPNSMVRRGQSRATRVVPALTYFPPVSIILASREPTAEILARVNNLSHLTYPRDRLQLIVALDQSVAERIAEVGAALGDTAWVVSGEALGKAAALNAGVGLAFHELLLFADSAQSFSPDLLTRLVEQVQQEGWGAATATLLPASGDLVMDRYWAREVAVRVGQAMTHSVVCVTGCAYIMRREYWRDMPHGLICDDLWSTYSVITKGARVGIVPSAVVVDPRRFTRDQEYVRRLRTMTGLLQFVLWFPAVLDPGANPILSHFALHKLIRPMTPILLLLAGGSLIGLLAQWSQVVASAILLLLGFSAFVLRISARGKGRFGESARTAVFAAKLAFMPLQACRKAIMQDWNVWEPRR